jgi:anti-sigma regulatory factor (Ser/Thr protein kinase)
VTTTAAAAGTRRYIGTYPAEPAQVRQARAALATLLRGCPLADDVILVASELATNSVRHSASRDGGEFTLRAEIRVGFARIEVEDAGGPWGGGPGDDGRPHGFDVVDAIAGPRNWGICGDADGRTAWATLGG